MTADEVVEVGTASEDAPGEAQAKPSELEGWRALLESAVEKDAFEQRISGCVSQWSRAFREEPVPVVGHRSDCLRGNCDGRSAWCEVECPGWAENMIHLHAAVPLWGYPQFLAALQSGPAILDVHDLGGCDQCLRLQRCGGCRRNEPCPSSFRFALDPAPFCARCVDTASMPPPPASIADVQMA